MAFINYDPKLGGDPSLKSIMMDKPVQAAGTINAAGDAPPPSAAYQQPETNIAGTATAPALPDAKQAYQDKMNVNSGIVNRNMLGNVNKVVGGMNNTQDALGSLGAGQPYNPYRWYA